MMTLKQNFIVALSIFAICAVLAFKINTVSANPDQIIDFYINGTTGQATTSLAWMSPGNATSTDTADTQSDGGLPAKSATILVALTGSTSATTLNISLEYSQNNLDWFGDVITVGTAASSTPSINNTAKFSLTAGTSTNSIGGGGNNVNTIFRAFTVPVPTRYVRAVLTLASSTVITAAGGNGSVWADIVAKKETR